MFPEQKVLSGAIQRTGLDSQYTVKKNLASGMYYLVVSSNVNEKRVVRFVVL